MKNIYLFFFFVLPFVVASQTQLELLEEAYINFEKKKYKKSVNLFEKYYQNNKGNKTDYYFTAINYAKLKKRKKALKYADMAATGIETYGMILADSMLTFIHEDISPIFNALKDFYEFKDSFKPFEQRKNLDKIDSLYQRIPVKKVEIIDLIQLIKLAKYQKDTTKIISYVRDAVSNLPSNWFHREISVRNVIKGYLIEYKENLDEFFPFIKELNPSIWYRYFNTFDTKDVEKRIKWMNLKLLPSFVGADTYYNIACAYSRNGDFKKATNYLMHAIEVGFFDFEHLFQDTDLFPLFNSDEGQSFLRYFISKYYEDTFLKTNIQFLVKKEHTTESKRIQYNYLKAKDFLAQIPRYFDRYEILSGKRKEDKVYVPHGWHDEYENPEVPFVFSINEDKKIQITPQKDITEYILLGKKTNDSNFIDKAGRGYLFPSQNGVFFKKINSDAITLSRIPKIQSKHLKPLLRPRFKSRLLSNTDFHRERIMISFENIDNINLLLKDIFEKTAPENLLPIIEFMESERFYHTTVIERVINILNDTTYYFDLEKKDKIKFQESINQLLNVLFFEKIKSNEQPKVALPDYKLDFLYKDSIDHYVKRMMRYGKIYKNWWNRYKTITPFKKPDLFFSKLPLIQEIDENFSNFILNHRSTQPIFYDKINAKIKIEDSIYDLQGNKFIKSIIKDSFSIISFPTIYKYPSYLIQLKENESDKLNKLIKVTDSLNLILKIKERSIIEQDRFFIFPAFHDLLCLWHDMDTFFISSLNEIKQNNKNFHILHSKQTIFCDNGKQHIEIPREIHALDAYQVGEYFFVLYTANLNVKPYCENVFFGRCFLAKIDKNLEVEKFIAIPEKFISTFRDISTHNIKLIFHKDKLFAFALPTRFHHQWINDDNTGFFQIFDLNLHPISDLIKINNKNSNTYTNKDSSPLVVSGDDIFIVYTLKENKESFLVIKKILADGKISNPVYLANLEGFIIKDDELTEIKQNRLRYTYTLSQNKGKYYKYGYFNVNLEDIFFDFN